jgi:AcrR family transcriptional regulator
MSKEQINKRKLQAIETKKKIYEAARLLVIEHGIEKISVDSIVEAAAVSKGAFYVHFESKDALLAALVDDYTNMADMDYRSFLSTISDNTSSLDTIVMLIEKISDFIQFHIGFENMRALYKAHLTMTSNSTSLTSHSREIYNLFIEVLERGVKRGELREDIPTDSLSRHLVLAIRGITFEWCIRYPDFDLKEQVLSHFRILLYGLKR